MEDFPLNQAHREYRRAEKFESKGEIDRAISSHEIAASLLVATLPAARNPYVRENIKLQIKYHTNRAYFLARREKMKQMTGMLNDGTVGSIGSSVSLTSHGCSRDTSPQPSRNTLLEEIHKTEERLEESMKLLCSIAFKSTTDSTNNAAVPEGCDAQSTVPKSSTDDKTNNKILEDVTALQKEYFQLTGRVCAEMLSLEKENHNLQSELKQLRSRLDEVEKDRRRQPETSSSCLTTSHPSPDYPELPPLDLPPMYLDA